MKLKRMALTCLLGLIILFQMATGEEVCSLKSPDGLNVLSISLNEGQLFYRIQRKERTVIDLSPLGLVCKDEDFSGGLIVHEVSDESSGREQYRLVVGNQLNVDSVVIKKNLILKNPEGGELTLDLAASDEGFGFRYRLDKSTRPLHTVFKELSGFQIPTTSTGWLQPYHAAGPYTPAYEDFFFRISPGDMPPLSRGKPRGWCMPGLFDVSSAKSWVLIAESDVDGLYCASHLDVAASSKGLYQIAFPFEDEVTGAKTFNAESKPSSVLTFKTPWRVIVIGDSAADILTSTLVTDLATPSKIKDPSWIKAGRASWAWWSHPEGPNNQELFNSFTDLAADFGWEYTLFDAGWWTPGLRAISDYANKKEIAPLAWTHASDFYDAKRRNQKLDEVARNGAKGIKVDFWCSDRQSAMQAMHETLRDAAKRKLVVNFHGCTIPRGWHRTWPNLLTAEAVLGTESYFYESRYPSRTAEQNTILPFTRNVLAPMDTTPVALTVRKYSRKTSVVHELAAAILFNSGIIHYADSVEVFNDLPDEVKEVLKQSPAAWDQTVCLAGEPGRLVILARRTGKRWFIAGLNGTDQPIPINLNLEQFFPFGECVIITGGQDPLTQFSVKKTDEIYRWQNQIEPLGGFVLDLKPAK